MAFPFIAEYNFEDAALTGSTEFDSETDTGSLLNLRHYSVLAGYDATVVGPIAPWRGAYVAEWLLGDTNDHTLIAAAIAVANGATRYSRFYIFLGKNLTATADDVFSIYEMQGTANAQECTIALKITAATGVIQIGHAQAQADIVFGGNPLTRGKWICVEVITACVTGSATGTSQLYIDGTAFAAAVTNAAVNTAIVRGVLGTQDTLATTTGYLFMDAFVFDDTGRVGPMRDRYPEIVTVTKSTHLALGNSEALNITFIDTGTTGVLKIYDTDSADVSDENNIVAFLNGTVASVPVDLADVPLPVKRGMYVQISGTAPRALIHIGRSNGWVSHGIVRQLGYNRKTSLKVTQ